MKAPTSRRLVAAALVVLAAAAAVCATSTAAGTLPNPFTITARWSAESLGLNDPRIAVAPSGNLYAIDRSDRVTEISPAGKVVRRWGKPGRKHGQFEMISYDPSDPNDIGNPIRVGPDGKVYVVDNGNSRVEVFTPTGRFVRQLGSFGAGPTSFEQPAELVVDKANNVYVVDGGPQNLRKFAPTGKLVWTVGGTSATDPDLFGHFHLQMIDEHNRLLLTNDDKNRVLYLDLDGHKVDAFGKPSDFPNGACGATVDSSGYTYVNGCGATGPNGACCSETSVFDPSHSLVARWVRSPLASPPLFGPNGQINAVTYKAGARKNLVDAIVKLAITHPAG